MRNTSGKQRTDSTAIRKSPVSAKIWLTCGYLKYRRYPRRPAVVPNTVQVSIRVSPWRGVASEHHVARVVLTKEFPRIGRQLRRVEQGRVVRVVLGDALFQRLRRVLLDVRKPRDASIFVPPTHGPRAQPRGAAAPTRPRRSKLQTIPGLDGSSLCPGSPCAGRAEAAERRIES